MEGVIGYVTGFAGNFAPKNWAFCAGQIVSIASNTALFSILGTTYGGNGTTTFGLPDLRSRAVIGVGQGPGLSQRTLGEVSGVETATMTIQTMPGHVHPATMTLQPPTNATADATTPASGAYANPSAGELFYGAGPGVKMHNYSGTITTGAVGSGQAFSIMHPVLAINYIICLRGVFPARN